MASTRGGRGMGRGVDMEAKRSASYSVPAVERAIRILHYLRHNKQATVSEISTNLDITRSNCFAILKTLQHNNFISFDLNTKRYSLGMGLLEVARFVTRDLSIIQVVKPWLIGLVEKTGLSVLLVQRVSETRMMVIDREEATHDIRLTVSVGTRIPVTYSATGRAILAFLPDDEISRLISDVRIVPTTPKTKLDPDDIRRDVAEIRKRGYSIAFEESLNGVVAFGAPVFDENGAPVYSISMLGIASGISEEEIARMGETLKRCAREVTASIGGQQRLPEES